MKKIISCLAMLMIVSLQITLAATKITNPLNQIQEDSSRIAELNRYWEQLNKTVIEGDFEGYKNCFHKDAVIIFASGANKTSLPISSALEFWKEGFKNTKEGKVSVNVEFRFSQRIGNETTAHETGIFIYTSTDNIRKESNSYIIPFEMLLVKRNNNWYSLMEYQKPFATQDEWDALG